MSAAEAFATAPYEGSRDAVWVCGSSTRYGVSLFLAPERVGRGWRLWVFHPGAVNSVLATLPALPTTWAEIDATVLPLLR